MQLSSEAFPRFQLIKFRDNFEKFALFLETAPKTSLLLFYFSICICHYKMLRENVSVQPFIRRHTTIIWHFRRLIWGNPLFSRWNGGGPSLGRSESMRRGQWSEMGYGGNLMLHDGICLVSQKTQRPHFILLQLVYFYKSWPSIGHFQKGKIK